jgi:hypothetical protein
MKTDDETESPVELKQRLFPDYPNEQQISRFYATFGSAISAWQLVETALYEIYERAVRPRNKKPRRSRGCLSRDPNIQYQDCRHRGCGQISTRNHARSFEGMGSPQDSSNKKSQRRNQLVHFSTFFMFREKNENDKIRLEPDDREASRDDPDRCRQGPHAGRALGHRVRGRRQ